MTRDFRFREIPYNYTSFSDKEIILRYLGQDTADLVESLRHQRVTGRSARLVAETIGDLFMIDRNPYVAEDILESSRRLRKLRRLHRRRFLSIEAAAAGNEEALNLLAQLRRLDRTFFDELTESRKRRKRILFGLLGVTALKNASFTPFHRVAHATDATDWRVEYPAVVVYPDSADEIPPLVAAARRLGLSLIARGGGTGLTGGAIPVNRQTMVINTEKLDRIGGIRMMPSGDGDVPVVTVEAGAVTETVIGYCRERGYIFATDPTSAWASTIGGNIAENAGGKKCVQWGTAIDNLWAFRIVDAQGRVLEVRRRDHPRRKILPDDEVVFDVFDISGKDEEHRRTIRLTGTDIRKKGLGKDITNKALNGLPGVQKEGGDGIIISAQFVLYEPFAFARTVCLEFFGRDMVNASRAIVEIVEAFRRPDGAVLTALEHFDERYVLAVEYRNRSHRSDVPKAVLLIDVEGNDEQAVESGADRIRTLVAPYETEAVVARTEEDRTSFWKDRKNLGAIARHTNAFKLNEDVVIPLSGLAAFADFIELLNVRKEIVNALVTTRRLADALQERAQANGPDVPASRIAESLLHLHRHIDRLQEFSAALDRDGRPSGPVPGAEPQNPSLFRRMQNGDVTFRFEDDVLAPLETTFRSYEEIRADIRRIAADERKRRIIVATHMHAGDGNVHVNIPVHSNDYLMMQEADETAGIAMREAVRLGGVISGEHGIGLTKLKYVDPSVLAAYREYKTQSDPDNLFNPGKLDERFALSRIYTPSFNLLELEAFILEATDLGSLSTGVASCVRCGKCKAVCCTQSPRHGLFYNPRNKILGIGLVIEAVLYHAQTMDPRSFRHFRHLKEIADHCTACHKCRVPCPVKIDMGNATLAMRDLLVRRRTAGRKPLVSGALMYLSRRGYAANALLRRLVLKPGLVAQRTLHRFHKEFRVATQRMAPRLSALVDGEIAATGTPPLRERLGLRSADSVICFENRVLPVRDSVLYFPGCGSERLLPEISMATIALLYHTGVRTVIPPQYACCGYPFVANGRTEQAELRSYENRVMLHRIADTVAYMDIKHVLVSCGTCLEMLSAYDLGNIFDAVQLMDVNEYVVREGLVGAPQEHTSPPLYHEPCHSPLRTLGADRTIESLLGTRPIMVPHCCGEAGTMSLSRPDVACALRTRKREALHEVTGAPHAEVLTTCPSCVLGLSKLRNGTDVVGKSLVVRVAEDRLGKGWEKRFVHDVRKTGIQRVIF